MELAIALGWEDPGGQNWLNPANRRRWRLGRYIRYSQSESDFLQAIVSGPQLRIWSDKRGCQKLSVDEANAAAVQSTGFDQGQDLVNRQSRKRDKFLQISNDLLSGL